MLTTVDFKKFYYYQSLTRLILEHRGLLEAHRTVTIQHEVLNSLHYVVNLTFSDEYG